MPLRLDNHDWFRLVGHKDGDIDLPADLCFSTKQPDIVLDHKLWGRPVGLKELQNGSFIFGRRHRRSLVRYHLHPESKFWGGEYEQRGPLRRWHVFALTHLPIGKESDQIEENEYIGEEAGPLEHPIAAKDHAELVAFIAEAQKRRKISDRALLGRAGASGHTLRKLRKGLPVSDKSLFRLVRAAEQLRQEIESVAAVNVRWIQRLKEFLSLVGSQNKLAKLLGVSRRYLGRVLRGEKPITHRIIPRLGSVCVGPRRHGNRA